MQYRAVLNRCAVHLPSLNLPIIDSEALAILEDKGFKVLEVNITALARQCVKTSMYRRCVKPSEAPTVVDCSSFIKWLYGQRGIWVPRRPIQQRNFGMYVPKNEIISGDLLFVSGDCYETNPNDGVGHVGIATEAGTIIHAENKKVNVVESTFEEFIGTDEFRGARRLIPAHQKVLTLDIPNNRLVETADDFRWIVLQSLPKR